MPLIDLVPASSVSKSWRSAVASSLRHLKKPKPWLILYKQATRSPYAATTLAYDPCSNRPSLLPKDPYEKAIAHFWAKFLDEKCLPAMKKACWGKGDEQEMAKEESTELLKILEGTHFGARNSLGVTILEWLI
ncbi:unnamed protein product [Fraxinus pennsylvanica]|uniref:Glutathione S-transferase n=1 Tax=Fraxinus pennsylvanica TaxID=56036 RepID=A0AAD2A891_9LAMI|nr:unnamed protein product [Fraxinus pennsylvanica]